MARPQSPTLALFPTLLLYLSTLVLDQFDPVLLDRDAYVPVSVVPNLMHQKIFRLEDLRIDNCA